MKVLITGHPYQSLEFMEKIFIENGIEWEVSLAKDPTEIIEATKEADIILTGLERYDKETIAGLGQCKMILRQGVGYDNIDVAAATARGIMVANVPDFCTEEVSDHTLALLLAIARRIIPGLEAVKEGKWGPRAVDIRDFHRIRGQVLGLYGYGRISTIVARKAAALGMKCIACDPFVSREEMEKNQVEKVEMRELLRRSDYISIHSPLTKETQNAFNLEAFKDMKEAAWIINTARGPIVEENDLETALDQGMIAGAALDVLVKEPPDREAHPLIDHPKVIINPHIAWMSMDALEDLQVKSAEEVVRVFRGEKPRNIVNPEVLK